MKILVTGGAGYIGSVFVPTLLQKGHEVTVLDNFMYNQSSLLDVCYSDRLDIIRGDARNEETLKGALEGVDAIFPLAAIVGMPACDSDELAAVSTNYEAIKSLLELRDEDQRIIFPCTNSGYGIGQEGIYCTEETPLNPISLYGRTKVDAERAILDAGNSLTLRLATVFGLSPRMRMDLLVNDFTYKAVTEKSLTLFESKFKRNFVHIRDVAKAFNYCLENFDEMKGEPYNFGLSDTNISKLELCEEIKKQVPKFYFVEYEGDDWITDPDKRNYIVSNEKIEKAGVKAEISLEAGIKELIKGYKIIRQNQFTNL